MHKVLVAALTLHTWHLYLTESSKAFQGKGVFTHKKMDIPSGKGTCLRSSSEMAPYLESQARSVPSRDGLSALNHLKAGSPQTVVTLCSRATFQQGGMI